MQSWIHKPSSEFLTYLAELTTGCTGADLQALCSEAFLCCVKRLYPNINNGSARNKIFIDKLHLKVNYRFLKCSRIKSLKFVRYKNVIF